MPHSTSVFNVEKAVEANKAIDRYHVRISQPLQGLIQEGEIDESQHGIRFQIQLGKTKLPPALYFRAGDKSYGRHFVSGAWVKITTPAAFPSYFRAAVGLLKTRKIRSAKLEKDVWEIELEGGCLPPKKDPVRFFKSVLADPLPPDTESLLAKFVEASRDMTATTKIYVAQEDLCIKRLTITTTFCGITNETEYAFKPTTAPLKPVPPDALKASGAECPLMMLFLEIPSIQGWCLKTHRSWADASLQLIRDNDPARRYEELYHDAWGSHNAEDDVDPRLHPLLIGANDEDETSMPDFYGEWFGNRAGYYILNDYYRDYNHFGGGEEGLAFDASFLLRGCPTPPVPSLCYCSAKNWSYVGYSPRDINPDGVINRLNFPEAVAQYQRYTYEGRRNAMLILGHVLHLLQDQAMPDHSGRVAHAGSSFTEEQAWETFHLKEIFSVEAAAIAATAAEPGCMFVLWFVPFLDLACTAAAADAAYQLASAVCDAFIAANSSDVGYERLVKDQYDSSRLGDLNLSDYLLDNYDAHFQRAMEESLRHLGGFSQPLGMGPFLGLLLTLPAPWSMLKINPEIDSSDRPEVNRYMHLTDQLAPIAIGRGASLLMHFYEIVNPPPFVEQITISQGGDQTRAHFEWTDIKGGGEEESVVRRDKASMNFRLYHGVKATIKIKFGPRCVGRSPDGPNVKGTNRKMSEAAVYLDDKRSALVESREENGDWVYSNTFIPAVVNSVEPRRQLIRVEGRDDSPHRMENGLPNGMGLDNHPESIARRPNLSPYQTWESYSTGEADAYTEVVDSGMVEAILSHEVIASWCHSGDNQGMSINWTIGAGEDYPVLARLSMKARDTSQLVLTEGDEWGRYFLQLPDSVDYTSGDGSRQRIRLVDSGLSCVIQDPLANSTDFRVTASADTQIGKYGVTVSLSYRFNQGLVVPLAEVLFNLNVISAEEAAGIYSHEKRMEILAREMTRHEANWRDFEALLEKVRILLAEAGKKAEVYIPGGYWPVPRPNALDIITYPDVVYWPSKGEIVRRPLSETGISLRQNEKNLNELSISAQSGTPAGLYLIMTKLSAKNLRSKAMGLFVEVEGKK